MPGKRQNFPFRVKPQLRHKEARLQSRTLSINLTSPLLNRNAGMAELADAADSKSAGLRPLGVRLPLPAPSSKLMCLDSSNVPNSTKNTIFSLGRPHEIL